MADTAPTKIEEKQFVEFYGMSSKSANNKHFGGLKDYLNRRKNCACSYRGTIANTVQNILGGIRSACTYAGAVRLKHLSRCTTFTLYTNPNSVMKIIQLDTKVINNSERPKGLKFNLAYKRRKK